MATQYYVSVTGLGVKSLFHLPKFFYHSRRAFNDAQEAPGNISSRLTKYKSVYMTITVWESKEAMRNFFRGKAHVAAMKVNKEVSNYGKITGYFLNKDLDESELEKKTSDEYAIQEWRGNGRRVLGDADSSLGD